MINWESTIKSLNLSYLGILLKFQGHQISRRELAGLNNTTFSAKNKIHRNLPNISPNTANLKLLGRFNRSTAIGFCKAVQP